MKMRKHAAIQSCSIVLFVAKLFKMRSILFFGIVLFFWTQQMVQTQHPVYEVNEANNDHKLRSLNTYNYKTKLQNLNEVKKKIKKDILGAWDLLKNIAKNENSKIHAWVEKIKKLNIIFVEQLDKLKIEFQKITSKIKSIDENIKSCLKENKNNIEHLFRNIVSNVTHCISNNVNTLSNIEMSHVLLNIDDFTFFSNVQNKFGETCADNDEKCLDEVHRDVIKELETEAQDISGKHIEARNAIDNRLNYIVTCIAEGLTKAAAILIDETVKIIQCVKDKI